jgi:peptidoglycan DL-endopeptidase CwlO
MRRLGWMISLLTAVVLFSSATVFAQATVRPGDEGADVRRLQEALRRLNYNVTADGKYGPATVRAVRELQTSRSLVADGVVGRSTWAVLNPLVGTPGTSSERKLMLTSPRMFGDDVKEVQRLLSTKGIAVSPTDGVFGSGLEASIRSFQRQRGLPVDGRVGPETWRALRS